MGAVGVLAPILWQLWGQCPHFKINDITVLSEARLNNIMLYT